MKEEKRLKKVALWYQPSKCFDLPLIKSGAKLIKEKARGPKVLELGCSSGIMTQELVKKFPKVVVVEGSQKYLQQAQKRVENKAVFHLSLFENFQTEEKFNSIIMTHVLEHVKNPVFLLKKVKRWLAKKGTIHIIVPNALSLHRRIGQKMGLLKNLTDFSPRDKKVGHRRVYNFQTLKKDVEKADLKIVHYEGVLLKPLSHKQMEKWPRKLISAFFEIGKELPEYCAEIYLICRPK